MSAHFGLTFSLVPDPSVNVTALSNQTVGQSLTLQCEATTVRGVTSRVDIVWSSDGILLRRINDTTADNSSVYTDSYNISQLSTTDNGRVIQCEVVINTSPTAMGGDNIILDVTGEQLMCYCNTYILSWCLMMHPCIYMYIDYIL